MKLLYECIPIAFLIEAAKGTATDGEKNILDIEIEGYEQKTAFVAGSSGEVEFVNNTVKNGGVNVKSLDEEAKIILEQLGNR